MSPREAARPCLIPTCHSLAIAEGYCDRHASHRFSRKKNSRRKTLKGPLNPYGRRHRKLREITRQKQPICAVPGCGQPGVEMDHIDGDPWNIEDDNRQMLCKSHHSEKTNREQGGGWEKHNRGKGH